MTPPACGLSKPHGRDVELFLLLEGRTRGRSDQPRLLDGRYVLVFLIGSNVWRPMLGQARAYVGAVGAWRLSRGC